MKLITLVVLALLSSNVYSDYSLPHNDSPLYNEYFKNCVINSDEIMINLHDTLIQVDENIALRLVDKFYTKTSENTLTLLRQMVGTLYDEDMEFEDKLDKYFYSCLNEVNIAMENINE